MGGVGRPPLKEKRLQRCIFYIPQAQVDYIQSVVKREEYASASQFMRRLLEAWIQ